MKDNGEAIWALAKGLLDAEADIGKYAVALYLKSVAAMTGQSVDSVMISIENAVDETSLSVQYLGPVQ